jgi:chitinase domain-containing protein 1
VITIILLLQLQWNGHGYDVAKIFANKFDLISPVWLQVTPTPGGKGYVMTGNN